jgi:hypothetical protein
LLLERIWFGSPEMSTILQSDGSPNSTASNMDSSASRTGVSVISSVEVSAFDVVTVIVEVTREPVVVVGLSVVPVVEEVVSHSVVDRKVGLKSHLRNVLLFSKIGAFDRRPIGYRRCYAADDFLRISGLATSAHALPAPASDALDTVIMT